MMHLNNNRGGYSYLAPRLISNLALAPCLMMFLFPPTSLVRAQNNGIAPLRIENVAVPLGEFRWNWKAYVAGPPQEIAQIECVIYTLHPTFVEPVRKICDNSDANFPYALDAVGWGTFSLRARIEFKNGSSREYVHALSFSRRPSKSQ
ncbi:pYEATS domain-containing protein [Falsiroseomonas sp. E2-1-a20]|uniref:pYEATS domain-containing protein n=1 Tax=Falsiroseomonas sp. E2-1-a20 TaxID=3239300 RepID=UPI003F2A1AE6